MKQNNTLKMVGLVAVIVVMVVLIAVQWKKSVPQAVSPAMKGSNEPNPNALMPGGMKGGPGSKMFQRSLGDKAGATK